MVAPLAGAWIEISINVNTKIFFSVAPLAGAWIEIVENDLLKTTKNPSHPSRVRGLK